MGDAALPHLDFQGTIKVYYGDEGQIVTRNAVVPLSGSRWTVTTTPVLQERRRGLRRRTERALRTTLTFYSAGESATVLYLGNEHCARTLSDQAHHLNELAA